MTPEVLAIIDQGAPKPQSQTPVVAVDSAKAQAVPAPKPLDAPQQSPRRALVKEREPESVAIVSATFRLPANIPPALLKASSERKIKKIHPFTQQDIVAEALKEWLKKNGFSN